MRATETGWVGDEGRRGPEEEADVDEEETSEGAGECERADAEATSDVRVREVRGAGAGAARTRWWKARWRRRVPARVRVEPRRKGRVRWRVAGSSGVVGAKRRGRVMVEKPLRARARSSKRVGV